MSQRSYQLVRVEEVVCQPQIRKTFDDACVAEMAQSIRAVGVLQPIQVRKEGGHYVITDGELRWRAAQKAGLTTIPVVIEEQQLSEGEVILRQLVSNCQRQDLTPLESAEAITWLMQAAGWNASQAASQLGKSNATITRLLALRSLPDSIRVHVQSGAIPASAAYELARVEDPERQAELAGRLVEGSLTRDALSGTLKAQKRVIGTKAQMPVSRVTAALGEGRSVTVSGDGLTLERFIALLEELLAKARKVRSQGLELGTFLKVLKDQAKA